MIIYKATNKINGMNYIGQTIVSLNMRIAGHLYETKKAKSYFHNALNKYKKENFIWEIIKKCKNKDELDYWEKFYICYFNTKKPSGYNLTDGGEGLSNYSVSEKTRKKQSLAHMGKKISQETIQKRTESRRGYRHSEETKNKIRQKLMGHSVIDVIREKISGNLQGHKQSKETKLKRKKTMETIRNSRIYRENLSRAITLWWKKRKLMEV